MFIVFLGRLDHLLSRSDHRAIRYKNDCRGRTCHGTEISRFMGYDGLVGCFRDLRILCEEGRLHEALQSMELMHQIGINPSINLFYSLLQGCINRKDLVAGRKVYSFIKKSGYEANAFLGSHLIRMFALCGSIVDANEIFCNLSDLNVYTWNAIISAYANLGHSKKVIKLFEQMLQSSIKPNDFIFVAVLKACTNAGDMTEGKVIHVQIMESGFESDVYVGNTLIDMYAKYGMLEDAYTVFRSLSKGDIVTWNSIIVGYARQGCAQEAFQLFTCMQIYGMEPNSVTFVSILKACSNIAALDKAKFIHVCIIQKCYESDVFIRSMLIDMYAKGGNLEDAQSVFKSLSHQDVVTWNSMIAGYTHCGHHQEALQHFKQMQHEFVKPNNVTLASILKACSSAVALDQGRSVHACLIKYLSKADLVVGSTLIDMYVKCGSLEDARNVFDKLQKRDVVIWNAIMAGHTHYGHGQEPLHLLQQMKREGCEPDSFTFVINLKACTIIAALEQGKSIHYNVVEAGLNLDLTIGNALIDLYAKCGSLDDACRVFNNMLIRDTWTWNAIIAGCAQHSEVELVLHFFENMLQEGWEPIGITFVSLLSVCNHRGLVDEGCGQFNTIKEHHGIQPSVELYNCMVDLLGRAGYLNEAKDMLETMPFDPNILGWMSLLSNSKTYGNVKIARQCFNHVTKIDFKYASGYLLMSSTYADMHALEGLQELERLRRCVHAWKKPGNAFIEVNGKGYEFIVGDAGCCQSDDFYAKSRRLSVEMKGEGHVPHVDVVLQPELEESEQDVLLDSSL